MSATAAKVSLRNSRRCAPNDFEVVFDAFRLSSDLLFDPSLHNPLQSSGVSSEESLDAFPCLGVLAPLPSGTVRCETFGFSFSVQE
mmetsp:Transcript_62873/g.168421  ORF Transcript_62873/g.168421 Transcript_62873/m.168421 type:complete len:86 (-) Transcript_62873:64-321(-)